MEGQQIAPNTSHAQGEEDAMMRLVSMLVHHKGDQSVSQELRSIHGHIEPFVHEPDLDQKRVGPLCNALCLIWSLIEVIEEK